jgi:hypothetical protein
MGELTLIKIKISGPGGTFGSIAFQIMKVLENNGAIVTIDEHYENTDLPFNNENTENATVRQFRNKEVHIHLQQLPWGG